MKISTLSLMTPMRISTGMVLLLGLYGFWWALALALHLHPSGAAVRSLLLPAALLALAGVAMQLATLGAAMRVLAQRRTPTAFSRSVLRDGLLQLGLGYLLLAAATAGHFIDPKPGLHPLAVSALLSLLACAGAIATLAARRYPSVVWPMALALPLLAVAGGPDLPALIAPFQALDGVTLAGLSLAWPLATVLAAVHPDTPAAFGRWMAQDRPDPLWRCLRTLTRRVTFLTMQPAPDPAGKSAFGGTARWWAPVLGIMFVPRLVLIPDITGEFGLNAVVYVGLAMVALADAIPAMDLHWRGVLAPGGWRAGSIGLRLWCAGAALYGTAVLLGYLLMLPFDALFGGAPVRGAGQLAIALAETGLLVAGVVALRGCLPARWVWLGVVLLCPVLALLFSDQLPSMVALRASWMYVPLLLALTAACVLLANRLWSIERLMTAARS